MAPDAEAAETQAPAGAGEGAQDREEEMVSRRENRYQGSARAPTPARRSPSNSGTVTIDNTNAIISAGQTCPPFTIPFYSGASLNAALEFFGQGDCSQCTSALGSHGTLSNVPNFTNYDYEIV